jgi:serine/threonine protein kinase
VDEFKRVGMEFLSAVAYLHERSIVHRDLKPENILLLGETKKVKLADFGLAQANHFAVLVADADSTGSIGTPAYMPPEAFDDDDDPGRDMLPLDVYAIGIILVQLWTKRAPWRDKSPLQIMSKVMHGKRPPFIGFKDDMPEPPLPAPELKKLIKDCWNVKSSDRPDMNTVFSRFEKEVLPGIDEFGINHKAPSIGLIMRYSNKFRDSVRRSKKEQRSSSQSTTNSSKKLELTSVSIVEDDEEHEEHEEESETTDPSATGMTQLERRKLERIPSNPRIPSESLTEKLGVSI